ncbi:MAG: RnfABCDGE type electron transport complex subunit D [Nitrososphaerota archaeon]|nr:RnfABCDGE type electron transport complex subunit D [Nitrososphaerota archaeon]
MSNESSNELVVNPAPHITSTMSKTRIMQYTFAALLVITIVTSILWISVSCPTDSQLESYPTLSNVWQMPLGLILLLNALIAMGVAVGIDVLFNKVVSDSELNIWSSAVFGLIVALSYSLGVPAMAMGADPIPVANFTAPNAFLFVALIALIGQVVFKKVQGIGGRKLVNPAAAAKLLILLPMLGSMLLPSEHFASFEAGGLAMPRLAGPIAATEIIGSNGGGGFGDYLIGCFANPSSMEAGNLNSLMLFNKFHGWPGGASSLLVIIVGIALFALGYKYFKWKVTASYFVSIAIMSVLMSTIYADADLLTRLLFTLFIGSSIFLGFFMATDPATTPFSGTGQLIFGVGLGILTVLIQTYMNFFGGSILALIIMNLTVPFIDRIRIGKPFGRK